MIVSDADFRAYPTLPVLVLALCAICAETQAVEVTAPGFSDGTYTVSFSGCFNSPDTVYCRLEEKVGLTGTWTPIVSAPVSSYSFNNKPDGEYFYRAHEYIFGDNGNPYEPEPVITHIYSTERRVIVSSSGSPGPGDIEDQLQYRYEVRIGDIDGDGANDLFVDRQRGGTSGNGILDTVILRNSRNGFFVALQATSAQLASAANWPAAAVEVVLDDLNADGFIDLYLRNVSSFIAGQYDPYIYSSGVPFSDAPMAISGRSPTHEAFIDDFFRYYVDPEYVADSAQVIPGYFVHRISCQWEIVGWRYEWWHEGRWVPEWGYVCHENWEWVDDPTTVYPNIEPRAVDIWEAIESFESGDSPYAEIVSILESVLGVVLGSDNFCTDLILYVGDLPDAIGCDGLTVTAALAAHRRVMNQSEPTYKFNREAGRVYITGHRIIGLLPLNSWHLAIEYRDPVSLVPQTVAAYCEPDAATCIAGNGYLNSIPNFFESDAPQLNTRIALVTSNLPDAAYFDSVKQADQNYGDCLDYALIPENTTETDYNSNGFVAGIIQHTNGSIDFAGVEFWSGLDIQSLNYFKGGSVPVPSVEFTGSGVSCP